jgi:hypothetical protein
MSEVLFARTGNSSGFGKCTEELKTHVPEDVKEKFAALAVLNRQNSSEYLRDIILAHIFGEFHVVSLRANSQRSEG